MRVRIAGRRRRASTRRWDDLRRAWSETSYRMRELRDDPGCAREEFAAACDTGAPGPQRRADLRSERGRRRALRRTPRGPKVAILREQGVNSQVEMAAAFERAGFEPHDVHMTRHARPAA